MPRISTNKQPKDSISEKETVCENLSEKDLEMEELKQQMLQMKQMIESFSKATMEKSNQPNNIDLDINPNKKTKITSLTYGMLTLYHPARGFLKFHEFGDSKTISYAQLVDYLNTCRADAEKGIFYIHDQGMVEEMGLSECYDSLLSTTIINKILDGEETAYLDILENTTIEQKKSLCSVIADKIFKGTLGDYNKVNTISKATNIDIMQKVNEMKEFEKIQKEASAR